jgi:hypothetical protein
LLCTIADLDAGAPRRKQDPMRVKPMFLAVTTSLVILAVQSAARAYDVTDTVLGAGAGKVLSTGLSDTAVGYNALNKTTTGSENTAIGRGALFYNKTGSDNTALGFGALYNGTDIYRNTAIGYSALSSNVASNNTALGASASYANTTGNENTSVGDSALYGNDYGYRNVAVGASALYASEASWNVGVGFGALMHYRTGEKNTAVGTFTSGRVNDNFSNTGAFGYAATPTADSMFVIGNGYVTVTGGYTTWSVLSDARFKKNVTENVPGLAFIQKLRPVTYNWDLKKLTAFEGTEGLDSIKSDKEHKRYTGFLAQEVERAAKETGFDFSGVIRPANERSKYMLSYSEFVVPLVKAVQEQQREIQELRRTVNALKSERVPPAEVSQLDAAMTRLPSGTSMGLLGLLGIALIKRKRAGR